MKERHEKLFKQLEGYRRYLLKVSDVTEEEAEIIPKGFNNNIRWNVGHVYVEQYAWIEMLTNEKQDFPLEYDQWFGAGSSPSNFTAETPSLEQLRSFLQRQLEKIKSMYGDRLEETFPPTQMWGLTNLEQVLLWTSFHEGMHLQTIKHIKQCMNA